MKCFDCQDGEYKKVLKEYVSYEGVRVPDVEHLVCDNCGETLLSGSANTQIDEARKAAGVVLGRRRPKRVKEL